ncbi:MAG: hypothetical protein LBT05_15570 [Planctomycetaceae bacterium]|jgi:hypothetical protein|nr:hypothetical protein [Planctomycetaceae bacterium]
MKILSNIFLFSICLVILFSQNIQADENTDTLLEGIAKRRITIQTACFEYKYGTFWAKPLQSLPFDCSEQEMKKFSLILAVPDNDFKYFEISPEKNATIYNNRPKENPQDKIPDLPPQFAPQGLTGTPGSSVPLQDVPVLETQATNAAALQNPPQIPAEQTTAQNSGDAVYLALNSDGTLTAASADVEALDRLQTVLNRFHTTAQGTPTPLTSQTESPQTLTLSPDRVVYEGRDYAEYAVRNLAASILYQRMQPMVAERFRSRQTAAARGGYGTGYGYGGYGRRGGYGNYGGDAESRPLVPQITPSDQMNTLIVRGSKKDRAEIEEIINRLDIPDPIYEPVRVPILNAELTRVMQQFIAVYGRRIQLTRLPGGAQVRVTPEPATNSVIIQAPEDMSKEFADYIRGLDEKIPLEPTRKIHIVQLEKINSNMVQLAIQQLYSKYNMSYGYGTYGAYGYPATGYYPAPSYGGYAVPGTYGRTPY